MTDADRALSGEQLQLRVGAAHLTVACVGASLRQLTVDGEELLDGYGTGDFAANAQGQALVPWPNRLAGGAYSFGGEDLQLPLTEPDKGNAIHGLARWAAWDVIEHKENSATLSHGVWPQPGYPHVLALRVNFKLSADELTVRITAANRGQRPLPYGAGFHPYLTVGTPRIDDAALELNATKWLPSDDAGIPTGERRDVAGGPYDFRTARRIGDAKLDTAFTDLTRDEQGRAHVLLAANGGGRRLDLWMDDAFAYVMAFTGDTLPEPERRRRSLGVEPMTCAPNAFASGAGLAVLRPEEEHIATWGLRWG